MPSEIQLAFAHPNARAEATATSMLDRISVRDHVVEVEIGAFQAERGVTQRVQFNIVVEVQPRGGPVADDVDRILSYDKITEAIAFELAEERLNLLETLAERIADRILLEPQAIRTFVRIEKLDRGPGALGVEIVRDQRAARRSAGEDAGVPRPRVVFVSNAAIASPYLAGWIGQLAAGPDPLILCVGAADTAAPAAAHPLAQRRIDLLAIEQNAWVLAAQAPQCKVVDTRTELDWAMKNGQICIWAPSKIVLDAVDGPEAQTEDAAALAAWLAEACDASAFWRLGGGPSGAEGAHVFALDAEDLKVQ